MRGLVPDKRAHANGAQMFKNRGFLAVRALHGRTARCQQLGNNAHASTADTDQMKTILQRRLTHGRPPSPAP